MASRSVPISCWAIQCSKVGFWVVHQRNQPRRLAPGVASGIGAQQPKAFCRLAAELAQRIGSGARIRTLNLAVNRSLNPVQK
jgi:hypothetical protein